MKIQLFSLLFLVVACQVKEEPPKKIAGAASEEIFDSTHIRLHAAIQKAKGFLQQHKSYNQQVAFLIDMKITSNRYRFFVAELNTGKILHRGMVAHGVNSNANEDGVMFFSNKANSYCTSLGRYRIGKSYIGKFGKAYRLSGLDTSNNNALARAIVLHQYADVPYTEQATPICNSLGCPMVSPLFFSTLEKIIDTPGKSILLDIYY